MIGRREFCLGTLGVFAATFIGCKEHVSVLKIPEDADECVDLFRFFTEPAFGLEQARAGLGATGEPRLMDDPSTWKVYTFDDQRGVVESIALIAGPDSRPDANKLTGIYIYYRTPINVSLSRLERYLGKSDRRDKKVAAELRSPIAMFTNLQPGQKEREVSSFSFYPDQPIAPGHLKGDLLFTCDTTSWDTKRVNFLRYERRVDI